MKKGICPLNESDIQSMDIVYQERVGGGGEKNHVCRLIYLGYLI